MFHRAYAISRYSHCFSSTLSHVFKHQRTLYTNNRFLQVSDEIQQALVEKKPVVALETTIYTHGFPYPENIALASRLESLVRINGGVPATIGILNGVARVGLSPEELIELLESAAKTPALKISRRDLGYICGVGLAGKKLNGGTTIAGTALLAQLAGIKVFATGGLGGVHRGGENSMDVSADLVELGKTPVAVISSGCKSFLDIPRTLEVLETQGVTVATFADGREGKVDFPAFWSRDSGVQSPMIVKDEGEAAAIIHAQSTLPVTSGMLFANPIPTDDAILKSEMDIIISEAVRSAETQGITGKDNTPYVLSKIKELSGGKSVTANTALVGSNVVRGTKVAVELAKLESGEAFPRVEAEVVHRDDHRQIIESHISRGAAIASNRLPAAQLGQSPRPIAAEEKAVHPSLPLPKTRTDDVSVDVVVAGSVAVDLSCDYTPSNPILGEGFPQLHTSNPATITQTLGGVGRNVATAAQFAGASVRLCSIVADDLLGKAAIDMLKKFGLQTDGIQILPKDSGKNTAQYIAVNDVRKDLMVAMADMKIFQFPQNAASASGFLETWEPQLRHASPKWVVVDGNWDVATVHRWLNTAKSLGTRTAFEPVSTMKSAQLFPKLNAAQDVTPLGVFPQHTVDLATPNVLELAAMHAAAREAELFDRKDWWACVDAMALPSSGVRDRLVALTSKSLVDSGVPQQCLQLLPFVPCLVCKLGPDGVLLVRYLPKGDRRLTDPKEARFILSRAYDESIDLGGVYMRIIPPAEVVTEEEIVSVNGVGDSLLGTLIAGLAREGGLDRLEDLLIAAQKASVLTLKSKEAVSPLIESLQEQVKGY